MIFQRATLLSVLSPGAILTATALGASTATTLATTGAKVTDLSTGEALLASRKDPFVPRKRLARGRDHGRGGGDAATDILFSGRPHKPRRLAELRNKPNATISNEHQEENEEQSAAVPDIGILEEAVWMPSSEAGIEPCDDGLAFLFEEFLQNDIYDDTVSNDTATFIEYNMDDDGWGIDPVISPDIDFWYLVCSCINAYDGPGPFCGECPYPGADFQFWNTSRVTDMSRSLHDASGLKINEYLENFNEPIESWDTSSVTDMSYMFLDMYRFDQRIGSWDTSAVTDMKYMFHGARQFNHPIDSWDTSALKDTSSMFRFAETFNQPIGSWNTSAVTDMSHMMEETTSFNYPLGDWDTSNVKNMNAMFLGAASFNQRIGSWNTSAVKDMTYMFHGARQFNRPIDSWNTAAVSDMAYMFTNAAAFNQPIGSWDTSNVRFMMGMFESSGFNQPIGSWDTSKLRATYKMFYRNEAFNQDIGTWYTDAVRDMAYMFSGARVFNQPLDGWDVSGVIEFVSMFDGAVTFNQDLSSWDISGMFYMDMFKDTNMPEAYLPNGYLPGGFSSAAPVARMHSGWMMLLLPLLPALV